PFAGVMLQRFLQLFGETGHRVLHVEDVVAAVKAAVPHVQEAFAAGDVGSLFFVLRRNLFGDDDCRWFALADDKLVSDFLAAFELFQYGEKFLRIFAFFLFLLLVLVLIFFFLLIRLFRFRCFLRLFFFISVGFVFADILVLALSRGEHLGDVFEQVFARL